MGMIAPPPTSDNSESPMIFIAETLALTSALLVRLKGAARRLSTVTVQDLAWISASHFIRS